MYRLRMYDYYLAVLILSFSHRINNVAGHGTHVAGVAAGQAENSKCGVGIAYEANIGGITRIVSEEDFPKTTKI